ncbi:tubulin-specific chaperone D-like isoform X1 [Tubulanus polymorphus]
MVEYQEQPHLLDPYLESLLDLMLAVVRDDQSPDKLVHEVFKYMYLITKTRGFKVIVRMMPHEVSDLEPVLALIGKQSKIDHATWETRYMLLLWLSMVCMIPFDMARLDSNVKSESGQVKKKPTMDRILDIGLMYLDVVDKSRDAAAFMVSKFLTRHDVKRQKLPLVIENALSVIENTNCSTMAGMTKMSGILYMLSLLFKLGKREDLLPYAPLLLEKLPTQTEQTNATVNKLMMKLIQRLGLTFLKARIATWRYTRGNRSLTDNLSSTSANASKNTNDNATAATVTIDEDIDVPEQMEEVIEQLSSGLRNKDTIVRWSAAKGIGRVTGRLPHEFADQVVGSVLDLFTLAESDSSWHGGCLALAELGRRGLLLPQRLSDVVPVVLKALAFDEKRGNFSVGAHVRDAACYVCWSFARAYDPQEITPYVNQIASSLVIASIFDREVNVRRAASAAFQENVGRQGTFPHGIDILTTCDYHAVGNRVSCYHDQSVFIAQFPEYTIPVIDHLAEVKVGHWDNVIRELTASALHNLTKIAPEHMAKTVLPKLLTHTTGIDLFWRHGSILAVAEITYALAKTAKQQQKSIIDVVDKGYIDEMISLAVILDEGKLYRGLGGELMRKAMCCLIEKLSLSNIPCRGTSIVGVWQNFLDSCLNHTQPDVQAAAVSAIPAFMTTYYTTTDGKVQPDIQEKIIGNFLKELKSQTEVIRKGYCSAIGSLPGFMIHGKLRPILSGLIDASKINSAIDKKWAEARRDAITAIARVCQTVGVKSSADSSEHVCSDNVNSIYDALLVAMTDYTLDSRGDVGAWVREAAMTALDTITSLIVQENPKLLSGDISRNMFCAIIQQSLEKIDRTRAHAGQTFYNLLHHEPRIPNIPVEESLRRIFVKPDMDDLNWAAPSKTFPLFTQLLSYPDFIYPVLVGLTISVGGLTESLVIWSRTSLLQYLRNVSRSEEPMKIFCDTLLKIFEDYKKVDRVTLPMFKMLDQLLANNCFDLFTEDESNDFSDRLVTLCKAEIHKSADPHKLLEATNVLCGMLIFPKSTRDRSLSQLMMFLCHRFPRVRKITANRLYEAMLTYDDIVRDENLDEVMSILSDTRWDEDVKNIREVRDHLCELMDVPAPKIIKKK